MLLAIDCMRGSSPRPAIVAAQYFQFRQDASSPLGGRLGARMIGAGSLRSILKHGRARSGAALTWDSGGQRV